MSKKVLHIALPHGGGGVDVYVRTLISNAPEDIENSLICALDFGNGNFPSKCKVCTLDIPREVQFKSDIYAIKVIRKQIKEERPDVVYCHSSMAGAVGRVASIGLGIPVIYNPHGWSFDIQNKSKKACVVFKLIEKFLAIFTKKIICISQYEKDVAIKNHICKDKKIIVVSNGIDLEKGKNLPDTSDKDFFTIGCAARISEQKSPILFADVMGAVANKMPTARFVWIGDGELREEFEDALKKNGIEQKTTITGWVNDPEKYISGIDVGVLFSAWEGFGLSVVDYLNQGKPVVASAVGGIPEILVNDTGILVDTRNPKEIAETILTLSDAQKREEMSHFCKERAKMFDMRITSQKTWKIIRLL